VIQSPERPSILVVDDSNLLRSILKEELEAEGYSVHLAEDGGRGLELARDLRPDAIVLDVGLPGLDGYEVCRRLKGDDETIDIPVLILSSLNELKDKLAGFEAGADDYLAKPFFTKELIARLRTSLRSKDALVSTRRLGQHYLEMLFGIGSAITSPFQAEEEVQIILRQSLVAVGAQRGTIYLLDPGSGELVVKGAAGWDGSDGPAIGELIPIAAKLERFDAQGGAPLGIRVYEAPGRQSAFMPMVAKERLVGGIEIDLLGGTRRLSANDQKVLYALASQAAIFLENARLEADVRSMFLNIIVSMAGAVDAKDEYTHGHSMRVARVALILGHKLGLTRDKLEPLLLSAILHDVGKIAIPDSILKKPERLDKQEFEQMKSHPLAGAKLLSHIAALADVLPGIRHHHEYWNGTGYPDGLAGEAIPLPGRIILIGDSFDAMTTDRVYRKGMPVSQALGEIRKFAGSQFDPRLVACLDEAHREGTLHEDISRITPTLAELIQHIR
jgi:response regulator RpfG family c-di-GMP phosphodiesterase